jgi:predicted DsbA family dithiol-disulfide isomerase
LHGERRPATFIAHRGEWVQQKRLVVFADFACPFCRLAESVNDRLRRDGVTVESAAFELRPQGSPLPDLDAPWLLEGWRTAVEPGAARLGVTMRRPALAVRTRKAHEAAAHARSEGDQDALRAAIYDAYWSAGRDIGRIDVLTEIGREVGLDASALRVALDIDRWTDTVEQEEQWAARLGLTGVPAYILMSRGETVPADIRVGVRDYDELRAWVERDDI